MAELTIDAKDIASVLRKNAEGFRPTAEREQVGRVMVVGDGIARIAGLPNAAVNELLEFEGGALGLALNLEEEQIGAVILGKAEDVEEGQLVTATGRILSVEVGDVLLGRVINALGIAIDGKGPIPEENQRRLEIQAPGITGRQPVHEPLQTGIKAIDAMTPVGRGQRELIIGDRKTGKTTIAVDTILNQKGQGVKCIYVAIGQKGSTVAQTVETLREHGALEYTVVVSAPASDEAVFKYLAPYAGCAIGQHWMENGEAALVVYDDLSKQAEAYRQISLLLRRPPGREAYPGDVFYLHSRLLERAAKLSEERGAGSLTALPVIETKAGDVSAYIPTNVISITDGQIYLQDDLFKSGVRPAVDVGISVSRVGSAAQVKAMKAVAGTLKLDLAQFRELEAFATFGSDLDAVSSAQLARGARLVELLKQGLHQPMAVEDQVVSIFAGTRGHLDDVPVRDVRRFEAELLDYLHTRKSELMNTIRDEGTLPEDELAAAVADFRAGFQVTDEAPAGAALRSDAEAVGEAQSKETLETEERMAGGQERILRRRIKAVDNTKKITRAMELIAASRIVKAQARVKAAVPYADGITEVVRDLQAAGGGANSPLLTPRPEIRTAAQIILTADRGLAGGYNTNVIRAAEGQMRLHQSQGRNDVIVTVGRKAESHFRFRGQPIEAAFSGFSDNPSYEDARRVAAAVSGKFEREELDAVELVYTRFISAGRQEVVVRPLLPLDREGFEARDAQSDGPPADFEFEPNPDEILAQLLPRYAEARIYAALLNAAASEHAARQRAMKSATDNAEDLITTYSRRMNRARQDSITTEIMEIVGGSEALGQGEGIDERAAEYYDKSA